VIPGLRLATYTASGFVRVPFVPFSLWVLLAVTLWTVGLYVLSAAIGQALARTLGLPAPLAVALPIIVLALAVPLWRRWQLLRQRRNELAANPTTSP
jgi:membrane protein DedA with SNARE-associated domain